MWSRWACRVCACKEISFSIADTQITFAKKDFQEVSGFRFGSGSENMENYTEPSDISKRYFNGQINVTKENVKIEFERVKRNINREALNAVKLGLLYMLETCIIGNQPSIKLPGLYLHLVDDLSKFNRYPWGEDVWKDLVENVQKCCCIIKTSKKPRFNFPGFHFALQIWAYETFPVLMQEKECVLDEGRKTLWPRALRWSADGRTMKELLEMKIFKNEKTAHRKEGQKLEQDKNGDCVKEKGEDMDIDWMNGLLAKANTDHNCQETMHMVEADLGTLHKVIDKKRLEQLFVHAQVFHVMNLYQNTTLLPSGLQHMKALYILRVVETDISPYAEQLNILEGIITYLIPTEPQNVLEDIYTEKPPVLNDVPTEQPQVLTDIPTEPPQIVNDIPNEPPQMLNVDPIEPHQVLTNIPTKPPQILNGIPTKPQQVLNDDRNEPQQILEDIQDEQTQDPDGIDAEEQGSKDIAIDKPQRNALGCMILTTRERPVATQNHTFHVYRSYCQRVSCGVFVVKMAEQLMMGMGVDEVDVAGIESFRQKIATEVLLYANRRAEQEA
ncbi:unnamed protein product [Cuscuta campestris]|uniref:DUF1985 domain-containing protein n=1 Tax=Cuscuta campestris TaxID=132261 RepID=A0A484L169_9ASTE|nr:unnamed protein product [Cuscuta campestris]